jgi:hypothetical protein
MEKINKTSKDIVDNVSVSVLSKNSYDTTLNMVTGMIFGLIMDIVAEGNKVKE